MFRDRHFSDVEIKKLAALEHLARGNWVGIHFAGGNLTENDLPRLQEVIPSAHISFGLTTQITE